MKLYHYDITVSYKPGDAVGLLRPNTARGREWLIDNVKGLRVNGQAMAKPDELLAILFRINQTELTINWKEANESNHRRTIVK